MVVATGVDYEFGILGPLAVARRGVPVPVTGAKQRALLGALLARPNRVVPAGDLIAAIWGNTAPGSAGNVLRGVVSRLRRVLAGDGAAVPVVTRQGGYAVEIAAQAVDVHRFDELVAAAAATRDPAQAVGWLREALALWRGEPLADVPSDRLHREVVPILAERRLAAVEAYVDARLTLGRHGDVVGELRDLTNRYPLRERFWEQLMTALYRCGRQAEALECYREVSVLLAAELGVGPGPAMRDLHAAILRADPGPRGTTSRPTRVLPRQLPFAIGDFTGRTTEIAELREQLAAGATAGHVPVAIVTGPAGIGKTALAVRVAHQLAPDYPDGQLFAGLGTADPATILSGFLTAFGFADLPSDVDRLATLYRSFLADRRVLVVLDDATDFEQFRHLLPASARSAVVVTSRERLTVPGTRSIPLRPLDDTTAIAFVGRLVGHEQPDLLLDVARRCGGVPSALRAAATRLAMRGEADGNVVVVDFRGVRAAVRTPPIGG